MEALSYVFSWGSPVGLGLFFLFSGAGAAAFFLGTFQNPKIAGPVQGLR